MAVTYTPTTNFGAKDSLPQNDPDKVIKGSEFSVEFTAIQTAFSLAAPSASPTFTGTVTIPTADINGGAIDGTVIGGATPAAASFTTVSATGNITVGGTVDGRDVAADGTKLDGIEAGADVTDTTNVTAAGALMDSELTNIAAVKALNQGVATTDSPSFAGLTATTTDINGGTIDGVTIGGSSAGAITGTTGQFNTSLNVDGVVTTDGLTTDDDANNLVTLGRFSSGYVYSLIRPSTDATGIEIRTFGGNATARFLNDGVAELWNNGSKKLVTTATGIDVTGTVTADGLTVTGTLANWSIDSQGVIQTFTRPSTSYIRASDAAGNLGIQTGGSINRALFASNGDISFYEDTGTTAKFFWDASAESLGIGTTSPVEQLYVNSAAGDARIGLNAPTGSDAEIKFSNNGSVEYTIGHDDATDNFVIGSTNVDSAYVSVDKSGNLLVGTTDNTIETSSSGEGVNILPNKIAVARVSGVTANFNRITSDGDIVKFRKDGTSVGSIGTLSGFPYMYGGTGFLLSSTALRPADSDGTNSDADTDLGSSSSRFKDLYLSGGVYLGGTGAANQLDDYEEGTWTPVLTTTGTAPTGISYTYRSGSYTKIGNVVYIRFGFVLSNVTTAGSGEFKLTGLPFTSLDNGAYQEPTFAVKGGGFATASTATNGVFGFFVNSQSHIQFRISDNSDTAVPASEMTSSLFMGGEGFYFVS